MNTYKNSENISLYKLPECLSSRATSIGFGNRSKFFPDSFSPSPNRYKIKSVFEENISHKRGPVIATKLSYKV
jgi:hypothetical protein